MLIYSEINTADIAFLVPEPNRQSIENYYIKSWNINRSIVIPTFKDPKKKRTAAKDIKEYLDDIHQDLVDWKIKVLVVADPDYFKVLTKLPKVEPYLGYAMDTWYGNFKVFYIPNYRAVFYNPEKVQNNIDFVLGQIMNYLNGSYVQPGTGIIQECIIPRTIVEVRKLLSNLLIKNVPLTCDIETFSLKHYNSGLGSITFCWDEHHGCVIPVDLVENNVFAQETRKALRDFFINFDNKLIFHNISFDVYILTYQLFMKDLTDYKGMRYGLSKLLREWDDTKLIAYLSTNSCSGNHLGLKYLSHEFSGNYAIENIGDIRSLNLEKVLQYNLVDGLSTWYVYNKYYPKMVADNQLNIYENLFKPAIKDIIEAQLVGMPVNYKAIQRAKKTLDEDLKASKGKITSSSLIADYEAILKRQWVDKKNSTLKTKKVTIEDCNESFNPDSSVQLQDLLYNFLQLPIIEKTETKLPATSKEILSKLINHTNDEKIKDLLQALVQYKEAIKIDNTFIPVLDGAVQTKEGFRIYGSFNLGGTVSGRLTSSEP